MLTFDIHTESNINSSLMILFTLVSTKRLFMWKYAQQRHLYLTNKNKEHYQRMVDIEVYVSELNKIFSDVEKHCVNCISILGVSN